MSSAAPRSKLDVPEKKRRGVTVVTEHGRAVSYGVAKERAERLMKTMSLRKYREVMEAMQEQKATRLSRAQ